ncbi:putative RNA-binding Zn ribbon-like protein [Diaminobutyricimonas aerilata]|uniref:Putative RNA-binding Zn ribbon-like protein n=1 Tax=Diaminobutyricimonas aerilata TaxID=1162967 RepID=A0A2M9CG70_9MICO|nr:CGNR zinc finger domain-containing protein [Diaminobutyricimonas aerilata]PJJ70842.1 putative RNA-binding Zn ribbon-like protein [Diaminobutyricimonas aerilata]
MSEQQEFAAENARIRDDPRLLRDFVNTLERQTGDEALTSPEALADWFADRGLVPRGTALRRGDLDIAIALREGLRAQMLEHAGHPSDDDAAQALDAAAALVPLRVGFAGGRYRLVAVRDEPAQAAFAALFDALRRTRESGEWERLKACSRDSCRWAYFDSSRNRSKRWCTMAGCGNYIKMRRARGGEPALG